jgi:hypothetical protein
MKYLMVAFIFISNISIGQVEKSQSKIEKQSTKTGALYKREFITVGDISYFGGYEIKASVLKLTDYTTDSTTQGLKLESKASTYLDQDEVIGLSSALEKMLYIMDRPTPENYTEYIYSARSGFSAVLFSEKRNWSFMLILDKYNKDGTIIFRNEKKALIQLSDVVKRAKGIIN